MVVMHYSWQSDEDRSSGGGTRSVASWQSTRRGSRKIKKRAEYINEVRRIEGFLQSNLTHASRKDYLRPRKEALMSQLGMSGLPD